MWERLTSLADKTEPIAKKSLFPHDAALIVDSLDDRGRWWCEPKIGLEWVLRLRMDAGVV